MVNDRDRTMSVMDEAGTHRAEQSPERALAAAAHDHHVSLFRHVDEGGNDG